MFSLMIFVRQTVKNPVCRAQIDKKECILENRTEKAGY
jgi:hypothetical protein